MMTRVPEAEITAQLRDHLNAGRTEEQATDLVLAPYEAAVGETAPLIGFVRPVVLAEARRVDREITRNNEKAVFDPQPQKRPEDYKVPSGLTPEEEDKLRQRKYKAAAARAKKNIAEEKLRLPTRKFKFIDLETGEKREVTWGTATLEEHRMRIANLRVHIKGLDATIQRHMLAIKLLKDHEANCLDEIPNWVDLVSPGEDDPDDPIADKVA